MNAQTAKITPGEWLLREADDKVTPEVVAKTARGLLKVVARSGGFFRDARKPNMAIIAEAGTVANETGLTPRQLADALKEEKFERQQVCAALTREVIKTEKLADQRAKLLTACEELLLYEDYPHDVGNRDDAFYKIVELARAAVKAAKQVNP